MSAPGYRLRAATAADIPVLTRQRIAMLADMGVGDPETREAMKPRFAEWAADQFQRGDIWAWLIEDAGRPAAGAAVWRKPRLPGIAGPIEVVAYVFNVYVEPAHRRRGLARQLMDHIVAWTPGAGFDTVELHASDQGRPLYASMGFTPTNNELRRRVP